MRSRKPWLLCPLTLLCSSLALGQTSSTWIPELVIETGVIAGEAPSHIHHMEMSSPDSLLILGSQGRRVQQWTIGPDENMADYAGGYLEVGGAALGKDNEYLVMSAPQQLFVWDVRRHIRIKEVTTQNIQALPFACANNGVCAWEDLEGAQRVIRTQNLVSDGSRSSKSVGDDMPIVLEIDPKGSRLAAAVNRAAIRVWSLDDGHETPELALQVPKTSRTLVEKMESLRTLTGKSLVVPVPGMGTTLRFNPDGTVLAAANETAIHVFDLAKNSAGRLLKDNHARVSALAFDITGKYLFSAGEDLNVRLWDLQQPDRFSIVAKLDKLPNLLSPLKNGELLAIAFPGGQIELWNVKKQIRLGSIQILSGNKGWIAFAPNGMFDTSEGAWRYASWRIPDKAELSVPMERFYRDFYQPGLIADILEGREVPSPRVALNDISFDVPELKIELISTRPGKMELVPGMGMQQIPQSNQFRIEVRPGSPETGAKDLQITHNGSVVHKWLGDVSLVDGVGTREVEVELLPTDNRISAYAFNKNGVRSKEVVWEKKMEGWGYLPPQRTLYVINIGVGKYKNDRFNLRLPALDAALVEKSLSFTDNQLSTMSRRLFEWNNRRAMQLLTTIRSEEMPAHVKVTTLINEQATRGNILKALKDGVRAAGINDILLVYFSGHGMSDGYQYYLLPHDMGLKGELGDIKSSELTHAASTLISKDDLEEVLLPLKSANTALILDACQSGDALEDTKWRGPLDPGGFGRLAYEKGIHVLAASEAVRPAFEIESLGNSLLTYALFREGISARKADMHPQDGKIELREWLSYGAGRVHALAEETSLAAKRASPLQQRARFAPRQIPESPAIVLFTAEHQP